MATVKRFEDLEVWKLSRKVINSIYNISKKGNFKQDYALRNQIRRSAISVLSNVAEGFEAGTDKQFARFLNIAKGSAGECRAQLYVALDQKYIDESEFENIKEMLLRTSRMAEKLRQYLEKDSASSVKEVEIIYES